MADETAARPARDGGADWRYLFRRFLPYVTPYRRRAALILLAMLAANSIGQVWPLCVRRIIDVAIPQRDLPALALLTLVGIVTSLTATALTALDGYFSGWLTESIIRDLRNDVVRHLHRVPLPFFASKSVGVTINRASADVDAVRSFFSDTIFGTVTNVISLSVALAAMLMLDWRLTLIAFVVFPFLIIPLRVVSKRLYDMQRRARRQRDQIAGLMTETLSLSGVTLVKSFAREREEAERIQRASDELMSSQVQLMMAGRWFSGSIKAFVVIGPAVVWFAGGWLAVKHGFSIGTIAAFAAYQTRFYQPVLSMLGSQLRLVNIYTAFERIVEYLDLVPEDTLPPAAEPVATPIVGDLAFEGVTFRYVPEEPVLDTVSFSVRRGQFVAFVGPSGAGKSTIAQLILRFYQPERGRILLDNREIETFELTHLRRSIGIVSQETYLFHDTIGNNLRYGKPDATHEELVAACRAANIHDFIASLPNGFETVVGQRGHRLSGGERQRLAIARALLKDPEILILDEATSSLDSASEQAIQVALDRLLRDRTSLVIAHRLSTIQHADAIHVLDRGRIAESGTHEELLALGGLYARLHRAQARDRSQRAS